MIYGEPGDFSIHYINIEKKQCYSVYVGEELWKQLTGADQFYNDPSTAISKVAFKLDSSHLLDEAIAKLAQSEQIKILPANQRIRG